jgi:hypothetical protein
MHNGRIAKLMSDGMIADPRPGPTAAQVGENHSNGGAISVRFPEFGGYLGNVG